VIHTFDLALRAAAVDELDSDPAAEEYVEGSLTFDGETLDRIGVRYKGSVGAFLGCTSGPNPFVPSGPKTCTKLSLKLKINWDGADAEFYGQRRVQLHAMNLDQSLLRDRLGYEMFREAGVPAPRSTHARVNISGEFIGLFALVEQIDGRFTRDRFEDGTGNLYKEMWPFDDSGAVRDADALVDSLKTNEDDASVDIMQSFAQDLLDAGAASDPDAARRVLGERTDPDAFISYAVVDRAIRHDDGPFHWLLLRRSV
jgi:spore coat protein CotH